MSRSYPLSAVRVSHASLSELPGFGLFDGTGYWHTVDGKRFEFGPDQADLAVTVARAINLAYADGQRNTSNRIREALGLDWVDE